MVKAMLGCGCEEETEQQQQQQQQQQQLLTSTAGIIFIATPHHGSWLVNQMQRSDALERLVNPTKACQQLAVASPYLARLNQGMQRLASGGGEGGGGGGEGIDCLSFGETVASKLSKWPVRLS